MSHKKFGPDRFSRFDVYWMQTNKQTNRHPDRQAKFIYRQTNKHPNRQIRSQIYILMGGTIGVVSSDLPIVD